MKPLLMLSITTQNIITASFLTTYYYYNLNNNKTNYMRYNITSGKWPPHTIKLNELNLYKTFLLNTISNLCTNVKTSKKTKIITLTLKLILTLIQLREIWQRKPIDNTVCLYKLCTNSILIITNVNTIYGLTLDILAPKHKTLNLMFWKTLNYTWNIIYFAALKHEKY